MMLVFFFCYDPNIRGGVKSNIKIVIQVLRDIQHSDIHYEAKNNTLKWQSIKCQKTHSNPITF